MRLRALALALVAVDIALLAPGIVSYALFRRTPRVSYHAMRRLYGPTKGLFNRVTLAVMRVLRPQAPPAPVKGFLGELSIAELRDICERLHRDGIAELGREVPVAICDELLRFACETPSRPLGSSAQVTYDPADASALRYDFDEQRILDCPAACRVALDGTLAAIAEDYFGCRPLYDFSAMWWTTSRGPRDLSAAAQMYHFDMDRPVFLKFFVYLTDVDERNGPHVFVAGSHRAKPASLAQPRRFEDREVEAAYPAEAIRVVRAPRGCIFAVDTSGIHKGLPVIEGHRLAFQVEFAVSRFGQRYPPVSISPATLRTAGLDAPPDPRVFPGMVRV